VPVAADRRRSTPVAAGIAASNYACPSLAAAKGDLTITGAVADARRQPNGEIR